MTQWKRFTQVALFFAVWVAITAVRVTFLNDTNPMWWVLLFVGLGCAIRAGWLLAYNRHG